MEQDDDDRTEGPRSFARFLEQLAGGDAHAEASHELFELGKALSDHAYNVGGKAKGKLTITLDFEHDDSGVTTVRYGLTVKKPTPRRPKTVMWQTKHGNFTTQNPKQQELPLHDVSARKGAVKEV